MKKSFKTVLISMEIIRFGASKIKKPLLLKGLASLFQWDLISTLLGRQANHLPLDQSSLASLIPIDPFFNVHICLFNPIFV